jgi:tetratricopeptide (TPR) repeat protein
LKADSETDVDALSVGPFNPDRRCRDWKEILDLSKELGDRHLENRAQGELGLLKILEGDPIGYEEVMEMLWQAKQAGDISNELRFRTAIAAIYRITGRNHEALGHLDRAVELAEGEQAFSFFPAYYEKALTFLTDNRLQEAIPLVEHCAAQARITGSMVNNAQALYLQGRVHFENSRLPIELLKQFALASGSSFISMVSLDLSQIIAREAKKALIIRN